MDFASRSLLCSLSERKSIVYRESSFALAFVCVACLVRFPLFGRIALTLFLRTSVLPYFLASILPYFYASSMFGKRTRQVETEAELYDVAVRALMRRAHSVHEMKQKLERRSDNKLLVQVVMARLKENGQIDDALYAKQFARQRTEGRKQGKFRVARDLRARGVPDKHIDTALKKTAKQNDKPAIMRQRIERKLRSFRGPDTRKKIDDKKMASIYSSLLRAGFSADVVRRELKA